MQCFFSKFLLFSFLVSLSYGFLECHDVQCPIQEFYVDGRSGSNFKFVPCRTCAVCREGFVHQILQVMITRDTCNHVNCGNDNESLTISITKASKYMPENCSLELDITYHCYKPGGDSNVYLPLLEDKHITVHVQLKVVDVELRAIANQSEEVAIAKYTEGETVKLTCKVKGPIPSGSVSLMYFHHYSNAVTIACSDHEGSSLHMIRGKTTKSERSCELLIENSQVINSGDYFCHVYLTGETDLDHVLESNTVTVDVAVHPSTAESDAMLHLGLEIGVPSGFVIVVLVVLLVATLVVITFQRRGRGRWDPELGRPILNPPQNRAAAQIAGVGYATMSHTHANRRLQQQPDGSSGQELVQSQDEIIRGDRRHVHYDFEYESDTGPVPEVAIRQRIPRGQQSVSQLLSGERNPTQTSGERVPLIRNKADKDCTLEAALSDHLSAESSKPSELSLPQGDSNIDGGEETLDT